MRFHVLSKQQKNKLQTISDNEKTKLKQEWFVEVGYGWLVAGSVGPVDRALFLIRVAVDRPDALFQQIGLVFLVAGDQYYWDT